MMNLNVVKLSLAFGGGILLTACGDDVTKVTEVSKSGIEVVVSADSLGKCSAEISGEMKFASKENAVYVCSDSSWKNVSAAEKASCSAETLKDSSGFKIVCGGDSVGVVLNGKDGKKGEAGKAGISCSVTESPFLDSDFGGGYFVVCGSDTVGMLVNGREGENCTLTDNGDGTVTQVCGASEVTLYKGFCGGKPFDPDSSFCLGDSIYPLCNGDRFDPEAQFCHGNSLYEKCAGKTYDPQDSVCHNERLFGFFEDARDGQIYRMVQIGTQTWMAENLNYAYPKLMLSEADSTESAMLDSISFCYDNDPANCEIYGRLYTWAAAMDSVALFTENGKGCGYYGTMCSASGNVRGACPAGWHLPDTTEWELLKASVADSLFGGTTDSVGYALKSTSGWGKYNGKNGSDAFGFGALPAGIRYNGTFDYVLEGAYFWSATENGARNAYYRFLYYSGKGEGNKDDALSVRCVKDKD